MPNPTDAISATRLNIDTQSDVLYKFYPIRNGFESKTYNENLLKSIQFNYLWFSKAINFNDPYDCYRELISYKNTSEIIVKDEIKALFNSKGTLPRAEKRKKTRAIQKKPETFIKAYEATLQPIIDSQGVCCFAKGQSSILMWSHYADCHRGLCLKFNLSQLRRRFDIHKVTYKEDFIPSIYFRNKEQALVDLFTTKSKEWEYEDEYRAIKENSGKETFHKSSLLGVTFGCKTPSEDITKIKSELESAGYSNVEFLKARMINNSFKLAFDL